MRTVVADGVRQTTVNGGLPGPSNQALPATPNVSGDVGLTVGTRISWMSDGKAARLVQRCKEPDFWKAATNSAVSTPRGMPVYARPAFFWWWFHFDAHAPPVFVEGAFIASSGGLDPVGAPGLGEPGVLYRPAEVLTRM